MLAVGSEPTRYGAIPYTPTNSYVPSPQRGRKGKVQRPMFQMRNLPKPIYQKLQAVVDDLQDTVGKKVNQRMVLCAGLLALLKIGQANRFEVEEIVKEVIRIDAEWKDDIKKQKASYNA